jgi:hypothetical protein
MLTSYTWPPSYQAIFHCQNHFFMKHVYSLLLLLMLGGAVRAQQNVTFTLTQQPCNFNGIVTSTFTGLTAPITVTYNFVSAPQVVHTTNTNTDVLNNYSGEMMWVSAVGSNSVQAWGSFSAPPFNINVTSTPAACPALGSISVTATGGAAPYTYQWINLGTSNVVATTATANLPAGGYKVVVTDANGCVAFNDSAQIWNSSQFNINVSSTPASCTNGSATVTSVTGGTAPYSYLWSNNATTSSINNLVKGNYSVAVTDANGCTDYGYIYINQTPNITVNTTPTPTTCTQTNGAVTAFATGGTPPYTYQWSNNINTQSQNNIPGGFYSVIATDANGCSGTGYANVSSSTPINATYTTTASSCTSATGGASLSITGGAAPYTITWSTFPAQTGATLSNVASGNYGFHIVDANGCVRNGSVYVPPVNVITANITAVPATCTSSNGSLSVSALGGATPYSYSWSNSATTSSISNVPAGNYSVTITDNAGCSVTKSKYLSSTTPVSVGFATTQASCIYSNDGSTTAIPTGGTAPYTYSWSGGGNTQTLSNVATGNYWVTVTDANGCTDNAMVHVPYNLSGNSCYCTITGTVYHDANGNCVKDPGEAGIPNIQIHCAGFGYAYTNSNGVYSFKVPSGNYTISQTVQTLYPLATCQTNGIVQNVTATSGCSTTVNFANSVNPIHDMHISTWNYTCPVPGFMYNMVSIISNDGTVAEPNIIGGLQTDNQLPAPMLTPSNVFVGSSNYYKITPGSLSLNPAATKVVYSDYLVPTNMPLNTSLVFKDTVVHQGPVSNWTNDYTPWNNVNYYTAITVGSYDPNFKEVMPKGTGSNGLIYAKDSVLEYMVHFQNLGTWYAQKVVVVDTLDADLNWSTLKPVYQSHPCVVTMDENGVVKFTFNNINLPAEMQNEPASHGMLTYTIRRKSNTPIGTQFTNSAAIYFDFNEPVITNTTLNTLGVPANVPQTNASAKASFSLFPNPAAGNFTARVYSPNNTVARMSISDVSGKEIMQQSIALTAGNQDVPVQASSLIPGLYFVTISADGVIQTQKLVIMK